MTTFGDTIQRVLDRAGLTQAEAAVRIGTSRFTISQLIHNRRTLTPAMAVKFGRARLGIDATTLLRMQSEYQVTALTTARKRQPRR